MNDARTTPWYAKAHQRAIHCSLGSGAGRWCSQSQPIVTLRISQRQSQLCDRAVDAKPGCMQHAGSKAPSGKALAGCLRHPQTNPKLAGFGACIFLRVPLSVTSSLLGIGSRSTAPASSDPGVTAPKVSDTMHAQARAHTAC